MLKSLLGVTAALLLSAIAARADLPVLRAAVQVSGTVNWEMTTITSHGFDTENGFTLQVRDIAGTPVAFAAKPALLLMDEPFVSLDPAMADEMMALFVRLRQARPLATLIVTHVEAEAQRLASRIIRLGGCPATVVSDRQDAGANVQLSASDVTPSSS